MKILYINGRYPFCYYYRGYLPAIYSKQMCTEYAHGEVNQAKLKEKIELADVIVFQRPQTVETFELIKQIKAQGKKVIFENDDTYQVGKGIMLERLENEAQRALATEVSNLTNQILSICDGAIASTPLLAEEYSLHNKNVAVLKNCIDPLDDHVCKKNTTGKFRVGFIGSVTTNDDYLHIKEQIKQLDDRGDVTIVVFGIKYKDGSNISFMNDDKKFWESLKNVEWQHYVPVTEYMYTLSKLALDLIIIPREESYFNKCKSNLKFLEASLLSIPVIAQGYKDSPYTQDKDYLTLVTDNSEWYNTIIAIKDNYAQYKSLSDKAKEYVLINYNIKSYANTWTETIEQLCKSHQNTYQK